jgi:hypothetical protein
MSGNSYGIARPQGGHRKTKVLRIREQNELMGIVSGNQRIDEKGVKVDDPVAGILLKITLELKKAALVEKMTYGEGLLALLTFCSPAQANMMALAFPPFNVAFPSGDPQTIQVQKQAEIRREGRPIGLLGNLRVKFRTFLTSNQSIYMVSKLHKDTSVATTSIRLSFGDKLFVYYPRRARIHSAEWQNVGGLNEL